MVYTLPSHSLFTDQTAEVPGHAQISVLVHHY